MDERLEWLREYDIDPDSLGKAASSDVAYEKCPACDGDPNRCHHIDHPVRFCPYDECPDCDGSGIIESKKLDDEYVSRICPTCNAESRWGKFECPDCDESGRQRITLREYLKSKKQVGRWIAGSGYKKCLVCSDDDPSPNPLCMNCEGSGIVGPKCAICGYPKPDHRRNGPAYDLKGAHNFTYDQGRDYYWNKVKQAAYRACECGGDDPDCSSCEGSGLALTCTTCGEPVYGSFEGREFTRHVGDLSTKLNMHHRATLHTCASCDKPWDYILPEGSSIPRRRHQGETAGYSFGHRPVDQHEIIVGIPAVEAREGAKQAASLWSYEKCPECEAGECRHLWHHPQSEGCDGECTQCGGSGIALTNHLNEEDSWLNEDCPDCEGRGWHEQKHLRPSRDVPSDVKTDCQTCQGTGDKTLPLRDAIEVKKKNAAQRDKAWAAIGDGTKAVWHELDDGTRIQFPGKSAASDASHTYAWIEHPDGYAQSASKTAVGGIPWAYDSPERVTPEIRNFLYNLPRREPFMGSTEEPKVPNCPECGKTFGWCEHTNPKAVEKTKTKEAVREYAICIHCAGTTKDHFNKGEPCRFCDGSGIQPSICEVCSQESKGHNPADHEFQGIQWTASTKYRKCSECDGDAPDCSECQGSGIVDADTLCGCGHSIERRHSGDTVFHCQKCPGETCTQAMKDYNLCPSCHGLGVVDQPYDDAPCLECIGTGIKGSGIRGSGICRHCNRAIVQDPEGRWVNPEARGDDSIWRETCEDHDTFMAEHEPRFSAKTASKPEVVENAYGACSCGGEKADCPQCEGSGVLVTKRAWDDGTTYERTQEQDIDCSACGGSGEASSPPGRQAWTSDCEFCHGSGKIHVPSAGQWVGRGIYWDREDYKVSAKTRLVMPARCPNCESTETRGRYHRGGWREYVCLDCGSEFKNRDSKIAKGPVREKCPDCPGTGLVNGDICSSCRGNGMAPIKAKLKYEKCDCLGSMPNCPGCEGSGIKPVCEKCGKAVYNKSNSGWIHTWVSEENECLTGDRSWGGDYPLTRDSKIAHVGENGEIRHHGPDFETWEWEQDPKSNIGVGALLGIVGAEPGSSSDEIRSAFRKTIKENHPDILGDNGDKAKTIISAYDELKKRGLVTASKTAAGHPYARGIWDFIDPINLRYSPCEYCPNADDPECGRCEGSGIAMTATCKGCGDEVKHGYVGWYHTTERDGRPCYKTSSKIIYHACPCDGSQSDCYLCQGSGLVPPPGKCSVCGEEESSNPAWKGLHKYGPQEHQFTPKEGSKHGPKVTFVQGDITTQDTDAIVNAANEKLLGGGGVDHAIHQAAGPELLEHCKALRETDYPDGIKAGEAVVTPAGNLPARYVIHAVGPRYKEHPNPAEALRSAHTEALKRADEVGAKSVAFPAISTGIFGYPLEEASKIAVDAVRGADTNVEEVRFVSFDDKTHAAFSAHDKKHWWKHAYDTSDFIGGYRECNDCHGNDLGKAGECMQCGGSGIVPFCKDCNGVLKKFEHYGWGHMYDSDYEKCFSRPGRKGSKTAGYAKCETCKGEGTYIGVNSEPQECDVCEGSGIAPTCNICGGQVMQNFYKEWAHIIPEDYDRGGEHLVTLGEKTSARGTYQRCEACDGSGESKYRGLIHNRDGECEFCEGSGIVNHALMSYNTWRRYDAQTTTGDPEPEMAGYHWNEEMERRSSADPNNLISREIDGGGVHEVYGPTYGRCPSCSGDGCGNCNDSGIRVKPGYTRTLAWPPGSFRPEDYPVKHARRSYWNRTNEPMTLHVDKRDEAKCPGLLDKSVLRTAHVGDDQAAHHSNSDKLREEHPYWDTCPDCGGDGIAIGSTDVTTGEQKQKPCATCKGIGEAHDFEYWDSDEQLHDFSNYPNFKEMSIPDKEMKKHLKDTHEADDYDDAYVHHQTTHGVNVDPDIAAILIAPKKASKTANWDKGRQGPWVIRGDESDWVTCRSCGGVGCDDCDDEGEKEEPLYWHNEMGWVDKNSAQRFHNADKDQSSLPIGGQWEKTSGVHDQGNISYAKCGFCGGTGELDANDLHPQETCFYCDGSGIEPICAKCKQPIDKRVDALDQWVHYDSGVSCDSFPRHRRASIRKEAPYGMPKDIGGDTPELDARMERCVKKVMKQGHDKKSAIRICKASIEKKERKESGTSIPMMQDEYRPIRDQIGEDTKYDRQLRKRYRQVKMEQTEDASEDYQYVDPADAPDEDDMMKVSHVGAHFIPGEGFSPDLFSLVEKRDTKTSSALPPWEKITYEKCHCVQSLWNGDEIPNVNCDNCEGSGIARGVKFKCTNCGSDKYPPMMYADGSTGLRVNQCDDCGHRMQFNPNKKTSSVNIDYGKCERCLGTGHYPAHIPEMRQKECEFCEGSGIESLCRSCKKPAWNAPHGVGWIHKFLYDDERCDGNLPSWKKALSKVAEFTPGDTTYPFAENATPKLNPQPRGEDPWQDRGDNGVPLNNPGLKHKLKRKLVTDEQTTGLGEINYPGNGLMSEASSIEDEINSLQPAEREPHEEIANPPMSHLCRWCGQAIGSDVMGTWVDDTGGDVCGTRDALDDGEEHEPEQAAIEKQADIDHTYTYATDDGSHKVEMDTYGKPVGHHACSCGWDAPEFRSTSDLPYKPCICGGDDPDCMLGCEGSGILRTRQERIHGSEKVELGADHIRNAVPKTQERQDLEDHFAESHYHQVAGPWNNETRSLGPSTPEDGRRFAEYPITPTVLKKMHEGLHQRDDCSGCNGTGKCTDDIRLESYAEQGRPSYVTDEAIENMKNHKLCNGTKACWNCSGEGVTGIPAGHEHEGIKTSHVPSHKFAQTWNQGNGGELDRVPPNGADVRKKPYVPWPNEADNGEAVLPPPTGDDIKKWKTIKTFPGDKPFADHPLYQSPDDVNMGQVVGKQFDEELPSTRSIHPHIEHYLKGQGWKLHLHEHPKFVTATGEPDVEGFASTDLHVYHHPNADQDEIDTTALHETAHLVQVHNKLRFDEGGEDTIRYEQEAWDLGRKLHDHLGLQIPQDKWDAHASSSVATYRNQLDRHIQEGHEGEVSECDACEENLKKTSSKYEVCPACDGDMVCRHLFHPSRVEQCDGVCSECEGSGIASTDELDYDAMGSGWKLRDRMSILRRLRAIRARQEGRFGAVREKNVRCPKCKEKHDPSDACAKVQQEQLPLWDKKADVARHREYECTACGNHQNIHTNHKGYVFGNCKNCSWKGMPNPSSFSLHSPDYLSPGQRTFKWAGEIDGYERCPTCKGQTQVSWGSPVSKEIECPDCEGSGIVQHELPVKWSWGPFGDPFGDKKAGFEWIGEFKSGYKVCYWCDGTTKNPDCAGCGGTGEDRINGFLAGCPLCSATGDNPEPGNECQLCEGSGIERTGPYPKTSAVDKDKWLHEDKPFSFGVVSLLDGEIEETHSYKRAEDHDFHHSLYIGEEHLQPIEDNEKDVFWMEDGEPRAMKGLPPGMRESIRSQIKQASYQKCPYCDGDEEECIPCEGSGIVNSKDHPGLLGIEWADRNHSIAQTGYVFSTEDDAVAAAKKGPWDQQHPVDGLCEHFPDRCHEGESLFGMIQEEGGYSPGAVDVPKPSKLPPVKAAKDTPYMKCPYCDGGQLDNCIACSGHGYWADDIGINHKCDNCDGTGHGPMRECRSCEGSGIIDDTDYESWAMEASKVSGYKRCEWCDGSGVGMGLQCPNCKSDDVYWQDDESTKPNSTVECDGCGDSFRRNDGHYSEPGGECEACSGSGIQRTSTKQALFDYDPVRDVNPSSTRSAPAPSPQGQSGDPWINPGGTPPRPLRGYTWDPESQRWVEDVNV